MENTGLEPVTSWLQTRRSPSGANSPQHGLPAVACRPPTPFGLRRTAFATRGKRRLVGLTRFELVTPRLSSVCSNQLSYRPGDARSGAADSLKTGQACKCEPGEDQIDLSVPSAVALAWIVRPKLRAMARRDL